MREHTLKYDDVMNKQRQEIYAFRNDVYMPKMSNLAIDLLESVCETAGNKFFHSRGEEGGWDPEGFRQWLLLHFPITFEAGIFDDDYMSKEDLINLASDKIISAFKDKINNENDKITQYQALLGIPVLLSPSMTLFAIS